MAEFLYAGRTITEELRNAKSNQKYAGVTPGLTSPFLPGKMDQKDPCFTSSLI